MKIIVNQTQLMDVLKKMNGLVGSGKANATLAGVLLEVVGSNVIIRGNGMDGSVKATIACQTIEEGKCCPRHDQLSAIVGSFSGDIELLFEAPTLTVKCGKCAVKLETQALESFNLKHGELKDVNLAYEVNGKQLKSALSMASSFVESKNLNVMAGINFNVDGDKLNLIGGTSAEIGIFSIDCETQKTFDDAPTFDMTLHSSGIRALLAMCDDDAIVIEDGLTGVIRFSTYDYQLTCHKMTEKYPPISRLIPDSTPNNVVVAVSEVSNALHRVEALAQDGRSVIDLRMDKDFAVNYLDIVNSPIEAKIKSSLDKVSLDYRHLQKAIRCLTESDMKIELQGANQPMFIREENLTILVSPCVTPTKVVQPTTKEKFVVDKKVIS